jgi:hypothetical protein
MRIPYISMLAAGALALSGCAYGDLGLGYGDPYYGYGYGSPYYGYGYGSPYYGGGFGYSSYYGGFGMPYYGWYDNFYYPGTGYYVYDSYRRPHVMSSRQRVYWSQRSPALRTRGTRSSVRENWSGFDRHATTRAERQQAREDRRRNH